MPKKFEAHAHSVTTSARPINIMNINGLACDVIRQARPLIMMLMRRADDITECVA